MYDNALSILDKTLIAAKKQKRPSTILLGRIFIFFGKVYSIKGNFRKAIQYYQQCLQVISNVDYLASAEAKKGIADVLQEVGKLNEAKAFVCDALRIRTLHQGTDNSIIATSLHELGEFLCRNLDHDDMIQHLLNEGKYYICF